MWRWVRSAPVPWEPALAPPVALLGSFKGIHKGSFKGIDKESIKDLGV